ncbi:hypothetical protein DCAR_0310585 [Daucus carota subsp. sativus]|uniref:Sodium/calcium exchanger membrane region domain-containing protein n=1 Tax=Daucus carota subsp. sativus TaxID=79200 RepID=A0AAF1AT12_DAUCS|nr:hypothetical protein DCAR_0310585 [Daucus carota subsp. sativus]
MCGLDLKMYLLLLILISTCVFSLYVHAKRDASDSWGISVGFISIILLPIVGNAAEHAGSVIFALENKLDISLGVSLGSATQISVFIPLCVLVGWIMGFPMDLDFGRLQTASLAFAILIIFFQPSASCDRNLEALSLFIIVIPFPNLMKSRGYRNILYSSLLHKNFVYNIIVRTT